MIYHYKDHLEQYKKYLDRALSENVKTLDDKEYVISVYSHRTIKCKGYGIITFEVPEMVKKGNGEFSFSRLLLGDILSSPEEKGKTIKNVKIVFSQVQDDYIYFVSHSDKVLIKSAYECGERCVDGSSIASSEFAKASAEFYKQAKKSSETEGNALLACVNGSNELFPVASVSSIITQFEQQFKEIEETERQRQREADQQKMLEEERIAAEQRKEAAYQRKVENSNSPGEKTVDYAIKWFLASYNGYIVSIKGDCERKHRINCIQLYKPDFIDEPQEIDHVMVCSAGVVIIETKHWKGNVDIRSDGKWTRKVDDESSVVGVESPKFQMRRHEILMQKILPNVPVHSLLCFSNASTIIDGRENFKDYPIITVDQLEEALTDLCANGTYSKVDIDLIVETIEAHKVNSY